MNIKIFKTASFFGLLAIIFGAFGAHSLKQLLSVDQLNSFETGVKYQMYHALFLLLIGVNNHVEIKTKKIIYWLVVIGILFFSGSIYLLSTMSISNINFKPIGFMTPIGGLLLILGWSLLFLHFIKKKQ